MFVSVLKSTGVGADMRSSYFISFDLILPSEGPHLHHANTGALFCYLRQQVVIATADKPTIPYVNAHARTHATLITPRQDCYTVLRVLYCEIPHTAVLTRKGARWRSSECREETSHYIFRLKLNWRDGLISKGFEAWGRKECPSKSLTAPNLTPVKASTAQMDTLIKRQIAVALQRYYWKWLSTGELPAGIKLCHKSGVVIARNISHRNSRRA